MPKWMWFAPIGLVIVALGLWGFRLGWIAATITETDVIEAWTRVYLAEAGAGALATDCTGRPGGHAPVWIVVTCTSPTGVRFRYPVDRFGRLLEVPPFPARPEAPQT